MHPNLKIQSDSPAIKDFIVDPRNCKIPFDKITAAINSVNYLANNACAVLQIDSSNIEKLQNDFIVPANSFVFYSDFAGYHIKTLWFPKEKNHVGQGLLGFEAYLAEFSYETIVVVIPVEPMADSNFCFKGDHSNQEWCLQHKAPETIIARDIESAFGAVVLCDNECKTLPHRLILMPDEQPVVDQPDEIDDVSGENSVTTVLREVGEIAQQHREKVWEYEEVENAIELIQQQIEFLQTRGYSVDITIKRLTTG